MASNVLIVSILRNRNISESSSSSEDEWIAVTKMGQRRIKRPRINDYSNTIVGRYNEMEFKAHFRLSRNTFEYLLEIIGNDLKRHVKGCPTISTKDQLMIAIWKMATPDSYRSICDRFNVGKATALRAVRRVTQSLCRRSHHFIQWPVDDQAEIVMQGFQHAYQFPRTLGAIDGTHIKIDGPKENSNDYINRKGFHSIQVQLLCDHRSLITHCYAGHPGSVHDQRVFRQSEVSQYLNDPTKFPNDSHLIGDGAYELHERLLTPFRNNGHLTAQQNNYNYRHSSARVVIERCIRLLKGRMRSLLHCLPMTRIDLMPQYVMACCIIHNICVLRRDELLVVNIHNENYIRDVILPVPQNRNRNAGVQKRNLIMAQLEL